MRITKYITINDDQDGSCTRPMFHDFKMMCSPGRTSQRNIM